MVITTKMRVSNDYTWTAASYILDNASINFLTDLNVISHYCSNRPR